jgi:hypothetical protein
VALLVALALPAWAMNVFYSTGTAGWAVSDVNSSKTFTWNTTGGDSGAMKATHVTVSARTTTEVPTASPCFLRVGGTTAATTDWRLPPGGVFNLNYDPRLGGDGWSSIAAICSTGQTATWDVQASR